MIGVPPLQEGSSVFQTTFSSVFQLTGKPLLALTPFPSGPRHWGQFSWARAKLDRGMSSAAAAIQ